MKRVLSIFAFGLLGACGAAADRSTEVKLDDGSAGGAGQAGPQGEPGQPGEQGPMGSQGPTGEQGPAGSSGPMGPSCTAELEQNGAGVWLKCPGIEPILINHGQPGRDGRDGQDGQNGQPGHDGQSVGFLLADAPADLCPNGGLKVALWTDLDRDNVYDTGEPNYRQTVMCNSQGG